MKRGGAGDSISPTHVHIYKHTHIYIYISIFISISISTSHGYIYFLYTHISLMPISQKQHALISACVINKVRSEGEYLAQMLIHIPQHHNIHIKIRITVVIDVHLVRSKACYMRTARDSSACNLLHLQGSAMLCSHVFADGAR